MNIPRAISLGLFFLGVVTAQVRPPNFSPDALPDTSFTCEDKITGGYYADVEADCQLFHVCVQVSEYEFQDFHFLCPNDTVFDQQHLVCANWFEVDCHLHSQQFFPHDFEFDKSHEEEIAYDEYPDYGSLSNNDHHDEGIDQNSHQPEDNTKDTQSFLGVSQPPLSSRLHNGGKGQGGSSLNSLNKDKQYDYNYDYAYEQDEDARGRRPPTETIHGVDLINTTPIPIMVTTVRRPVHTGPRVKSDILQAKRNKNRGKGSKLNKLGNRVETGDDEGRRKFVPFTTRPDVQDFLDITTKPPLISPFDRPPLISADGKKPRVKSNIQAGQSHVGKSPTKPKKQGSKKVELDRSQLGNINFVEPRPQDHETTEDPFAGPEVRPDGRAPRVKANILAKQQHLGRQPQVTENPDPVTFRPSFRPFDFTQPARPPATSVPQILDNIFTTRNSNIFTTVSPQRPFPTRPPPSLDFSPQPPSRPSPSQPPRRPVPNGIQNFNNEQPRRQENSGIRSFSPGGHQSFSPQPPRRPTPNGIQIFTTESPRRPTPDSRQSFSPGPSSRPVTPQTQRFNSPGPRNRFNNFPSSTSPPVTFPPLTLVEPETPKPPSSPDQFDQPSFNFNPQSRPENPPSFQPNPNPSFNLGPPPQPKIPPSLQRNRNRFGTKPRVKANELANKANSGRTRNRFRERVRNNKKPPPTRFEVTPAVPFDSQPTPAPSRFDTQPEVTQSPRKFIARPRTPRPRTQFRRPETKHIIKGIGGSAVSNSINSFGSSRGPKDCRNNPFLCPPKIKADGKKPRVKSDIKAAKRNFWHPKKKIRKTRKRVRDRKFLARRKGRLHLEEKEENDNSINEIDDQIISTTRIPIIVKSTTKNPIEILAQLNRGKSTTRNPISILEQLNIVNLGNSVNAEPQTTTEFPSRFSATERSFRKSQKKFRKHRNNLNKNKSFLNSLRRPSVLDNLTTTREPVLPSSTQASIFVTNPNFQHFHEVTTPRNSFHNGPSGSPSPRNNFSPTPTSFSQPSRPTSHSFQQPVTPTRRPFHLPSKKSKLRIEDIVSNHENTIDQSKGFIPDSTPTLQSPFTDSGDHLFVTNPRALKDHHRNTFANPPKQTADGKKPRVKSNLKAIEQNKPGFFSGIDFSSDDDEDEENQTIPTLKIIPDGRAPRVKSDIKNKRKPKKKFSTRIGNRRKGKGFNLELNNVDDSINDINPSLNRDEEGPEVRPDGRTPRVKSDIKAKKAHVGKLTEKKKRPGFRHSQKVNVTPNIKLALKSDRESEVTNDRENTGHNEIDTDNSDHNNNKFALSVTTSRTHVVTTISSRHEDEAPITTFRPKFDFGSIGTHRTTRKPKKPVFSNDFIAESSTIRNSIFDGEKRTHSPKSSAKNVSVPLPNINIAPPHSERFAQAVFEPTPKGFAQREQVFSDFPRTTLLGGLPKLKMRPTPESATEIIRVSKKDKQLFDGQYHYDYYYYEDHPF